MPPPLSDSQQPRLLLPKVIIHCLTVLRREKPNVALYYLKNALEIEQKDPDTDDLTRAGTHLNLSAIYSKLNKHKEAIWHSKNAIILLERRASELKAGSEEEKELQNHVFMNVAIAYYNLGANYEHTQKQNSAIMSYKVALDHAEKYLDGEHSLIGLIKENLAIVEEKLKLAQTSHLMRDYIRKEKATANIYR